MKQAGALLMLIGAMAALFAFVMDTTVTSSGTYVAGTYVGGGSTYNLGLLQQQMMVFQTGLAAFVAGAFLFGSAMRDAENSRPGAEASVPGRKSRTDVQVDETEEERDERLRRERRSTMTAVGVFSAIIAVIAIIVLMSNGPTSADRSAMMNVDENLITTDMNLEENLSSTDANSL